MDAMFEPLNSYGVGKALLVDVAEIGDGLPIKSTETFGETMPRTLELHRALFADSRRPQKVRGYFDPTWEAG